MPPKFERRKRLTRNITRAIVAILIIGVVATTIHFLYRSRSSISEQNKFTGTFRSWATALDEPQCAHVSKDIYALGGTIADATVASFLCLGVVLPESLGIGGGFFALYFDKKKGAVNFLDARETAPLAATSDMFVAEGVNSMTGAQVIAVPGELKGYRKLLDLVGSNLSQEELFRPAINIARNGFQSGQHLAEAMRSKRELIYADEGLRRVYFNPETNNTWEEGDTIRNPDLADTLEKLAKSADFVHEFYEGSVGQQIVSEVRRRGGILQAQDLAEYKAEWLKPTHWRMQNTYDVYSASLPASAPILALMLNILDAYNTSHFEDNSQSYQRLAEIFKHSYAQRSKLGDPRYVDVNDLVKKLESTAFAKEIKEKIKDSETLPIEAYGGALNTPKDKGTSHASFFGPNGDIISMTSSVNFYFGSGVQTGGVVLNNGMNDFSTPKKPNGFGLLPSESNFIKSRKRPMSSMVPTIVLKDGEGKMATGGAGGSKITTASALVLFHYFYRGLSLEDAINHRRIHHQYFPNELIYEHGFNEEIINDLKRFGHVVRMKPKLKRGSVIVGIVREGDDLVACVDPRKGGGVIGGSQ